MTTRVSQLQPYLTSLLCALALLFTAACGSDKGKVESVNMLYGTSSKVWVTDKETDAAGDKVKQSDTDADMEMAFSSNGTYSGTQAGKYQFDQAAKTLTLTPDGQNMSNVFQVETLTDSKLTLVRSTGQKMMLKAK